MFKTIRKFINKLARRLIQQELNIEFGILNSRLSSLEGELRFLQNRFLNPEVNLEFSESPEFPHNIEARAQFDLPRQIAGNLYSMQLIDKRLYDDFDAKHYISSELVRGLFNELYKRTIVHTKIKEEKS